MAAWCAGRGRIGFRSWQADWQTRLTPGWISGSPLVPAVPSRRCGRPFATPASRERKRASRHTWPAFFQRSGSIPSSAISCRAGPTCGASNPARGAGAGCCWSGTRMWSMPAAGASAGRGRSGRIRSARQSWTARSGGAGPPISRLASARRSKLCGCWTLTTSTSPATSSWLSWEMRRAGNPEPASAQG